MVIVIVWTSDIWNRCHDSASLWGLLRTHTHTHTHWTSWVLKPLNHRTDSPCCCYSCCSWTLCRVTTLTFALLSPWGEWASLCTACPPSLPPFSLQYFPSRFLLSQVGAGFLHNNWRNPTVRGVTLSHLSVSLSHAQIEYSAHTNTHTHARSTQLARWGNSTGGGGSCSEVHG